MDRKLRLGILVLFALGIALPSAASDYITGSVELARDGTTLSSYGWVAFGCMGGTCYGGPLTGWHKIYNAKTFAVIQASHWTRDCTPVTPGAGIPNSCYPQYQEYLHGSTYLSNCYRASLSATSGGPAAYSGPWNSWVECGESPRQVRCDQDPSSPGCGGGPLENCPVILDLQGRPFPAMSGPKDAVRFDLDGDGKAESTTWIAPGEEGAGILVLPNERGEVNGPQEIFGNHTRVYDSRTKRFEGPEAKDGFVALAEYNLEVLGGNFSGGDFHIPRTGRETPDEEEHIAFDELNIIDPGDAVFDRLRLWFDNAPRDGKVQPQELKTLRELGIVAISHDSAACRRVDRFGNEYRTKSRFWMTKNGRVTERKDWDVWLQRVGE